MDIFKEFWTSISKIYFPKQFLLAAFMINIIILLHSQEVI